MCLEPPSPNRSALARAVAESECLKCWRVLVPLRPIGWLKSLGNQVILQHQYPLIDAKGRPEKVPPGVTLRAYQEIRRTQPHLALHTVEQQHHSSRRGDN